MSDDRLSNFDYKPGKDGNSEPRELEAIRTAIKDSAAQILKHTKTTREQSLALTQLEQGYMWAVAAFCRYR